MADKSFGDRVKKLAEIVGGAEELGRRTGTSGRMIAHYSKGETEPSRDRLIALANAASVSVLWLATGEGPMYKEQQPSDYQDTIAFDGPEVRYDAGTPDGTQKITAEEDPDAVVKAVNTVMESKHRGVKLALTQNALMFEEMVRMSTEIDTLRDENTGLRRQVGDLERDMAAIKRLLKDAFAQGGANDLKPKESKGEKKRAGGQNGKY